MDHVLAQVNISRLREPLDSPLLADVARGFVWRPQAEDGASEPLRGADEWMCPA